MCSILKFLIFKTIESNNDKMVQLNNKKNKSKSYFHNCLVTKLEQLNQLYNSIPTDFPLAFNVGLNALMYSASLIFFLYHFYNYHWGFWDRPSMHSCVDFLERVWVDVNFCPFSCDQLFVNISLKSIQHRYLKSMYSILKFFTFKAIE